MNTESYPNTQSYPAAGAVAPTVHAHFARYIAEAQHEGRVAALPDEPAIARMIEVAFWASLRREEGYVPKISLAFVSPDETAHPLLFERALPLDARALAKVAPAVERPGIHLGVCRSHSELCVWGTARTVPKYCFVLEVSAPALLVIKHHRGDEAVKFVNVAVLEGDQVKVVDEQASTLPDCPSLLTSLLGFESGSWQNSVNVLVQLAVSMRAHNRGGSLLVVPPASDAWRESIVRPIAYAVDPAFAELAQLARDTPDEIRRRQWSDALARAVDSVAGLTAVDGALIMTSDYEVLAFGAKIARRKGHARVEQVTVTEPIDATVPAVIHPAELGGTRHLSAAQFVQDQRDVLALVASQDGHFTVFAWSPCEEMVHAHRIETLLL